MFSHLPERTRNIILLVVSLLLVLICVGLIYIGLTNVPTAEGSGFEEFPGTVYQNGGVVQPGESIRANTLTKLEIFMPAGQYSAVVLGGWNNQWLAAIVDSSLPNTCAMDPAAPFIFCGPTNGDEVITIWATTVHTGQNPTLNMSVNYTVPPDPPGDYYESTWTWSDFLPTSFSYLPFTVAN